MGKPRRSASSQQVEVLHFPFMAVLSCIIGALSFVLFIFIAHSKELVDTSEIKKDIFGSKRQVELKEAELLRLKEQLERDNRYLSDRQMPQPSDQRDVKAELADLEQQLAELEREKERLQTLLATREKPDEARRSELDDLRRKAAMLKASRSVVAEVRHAQAPGLAKPIYVECRANEAVVWPVGRVVAMAHGALGGVSFQDWLSAAGVESPGDYVVFLIRPSGIATFDALRGLSEKSGFKVGYEPVLEEWELFFS
ncbi:MAG: hypothetical protein JW759_07735 [Candidatus Coatesbacteria bacterium]|nr:hypothetical protein [Candidatus Coatesbacteria bacterium]